MLIYFQEMILLILLLHTAVALTSSGLAIVADDQNLQRQNLHSYCRSFKTCHDCKKASFKCEWCHDFGCTNHARLHCPKKAFLDNVWKKDVVDRYCTTIVTKSPLFVPANSRQFIRLNLKIDDMTLYERNIVCEIKVENQIVQVAGSLDQNTVYCDGVVLKISKSVVVGKMNIVWGGADPYSNSILLIVYKCQNMAQSCKECQKLNSEFRCGWCKDTLACTPMEECPRQYAPWISNNLTCGKDARRSVVQDYKRLWYNFN